MTDEAYGDLKGRLVPQGLSEAETGIAGLLNKSPLPQLEAAENVVLFSTPRSLKRMLFLDELYRKILDVHGVVLQFGCRWGRDIVLFDSLRTIYEPFNITRLIVGFDSFEGFPSVHRKDGSDSLIQQGALATSKGYERFFQELIDTRRGLDPLPNIERCAIRKGDAAEQLEKYLKEHPETIVAMAHFDLDVYEPTKACLQLLKKHVTTGSLIAFDELNSPYAPGETLALAEVFGLGRFAIRRSPQLSGQGSYIVYSER